MTVWEKAVTRIPPLLALGLAAAVAAASPARSQQPERPAAEGRVAVELNRLSPGQGGCQVYVLAHNRAGGRAFGSLQADLVTFGADGVVNGRLLVELAPLPPDKTVLRLFEMPDVECGAIDRVLLNEVARCEDEDGGAVAGCTAMLEPSSRAKPAFFK